MFLDIFITVTRYHMRTVSLLALDTLLSWIACDDVALPFQDLKARF